MIAKKNENNCIGATHRWHTEITSLTRTYTVCAPLLLLLLVLLLPPLPLPLFTVFELASFFGAIRTFAYDTIGFVRSVFCVHWMWPISMYSPISVHACLCAMCMWLCLLFSLFSLLLWFFFLSFHFNITGQFGFVKLFFWARFAYFVRRISDPILR